MLLLFLAFCSKTLCVSSATNPISVCLKLTSPMTIEGCETRTDNRVFSTEKYCVSKGDWFELYMRFERQTQKALFYNTVSWRIGLNGLGHCGWVYEVNNR